MCKMSSRDSWLDQIATGRISLEGENSGPLVSLVVAGDLCPAGRPETLLAHGRAAEVWGDLPDLLAAADLSMVNLECPLTNSNTPIAKSGPHLRADPRCAVGIRAGGFDVVTLANNHILDMGERGLLDTLATCREAGLHVVGAGRNLAEATTPLFLEINGIRLAILALAEHEFSIATPQKAGAWPLDVIDNYYQITQVRQKADFVLVLLHGGNEYYPLPGPRLVKTCRYLVDLGTNAVICHHTHVASGLEVYRRAPIIYGTGNFLFDCREPRTREWYMGYLVKLDIQPNRVTATQLLPYWQCQEQPSVQQMNAIESKIHLDRIADLSTVIGNPGRLEEEWTRMCSSQAPSVLAAVFSLSRFERLLVRHGIMPRWRFDERHLRRGLNYIACESLRSVLEFALEKYGGVTRIA